jgi:hypothetical protein
LFVPSVIVKLKLELSGWEDEGSVLMQAGDKAGAAGSSGEPNDQGICGDVVLGGEEGVVDGLVDGDLEIP